MKTRGAGDCVSIPSSSGHQFTGICILITTFTVNSVSIPSSSGHQFTDFRLINGKKHGPWRFNPFFIRASVYWTGFQGARTSVPTPFQSLLHQGISLLAVRPPRNQLATTNVSIPSSSGHQFTANGKSTGSPTDRRRFNPFFIRASVYCRRERWRMQAMTAIVSIPSSSGHQFTATGASPASRRPPSRFNPFFIRASVYWIERLLSINLIHLQFQSLLHQGISLLLLFSTPRAATFACVSIPSSSGHQFTDSHTVFVPHSDIRSFNPFFIRASVYC